MQDNTIVWWVCVNTAFQVFMLDLKQRNKLTSYALQPVKIPQSSCQILYSLISFVDLISETAALAAVK